MRHLSILLILMLLPLACAGPYTTYYKNRGQPVQPEPFWECKIDPNIWIPNINLVGKANTHSYSDPPTQISRYDSISAADTAIDEICEGGLSFHSNQHISPGDIDYGGSGERRYCASEGNQPSDEFGSRHSKYESFVVLQRGEVVVLIFETVGQEQDIGKPTNLAIASVCEDIHKTTELDPKGRLEIELNQNGGQGRDLSNMDLSNMNLSGVEDEILADENRLSYLTIGELPSFAEADLSGADLSETILVSLNLAGANLSGANLQGADLRHALAAQTILKDADLRGANLLHASLGQARLHQAILDETTLIDEKWRIVWKTVNSGDRGRDLRGLDLSAANLSGADLSQANLSGADLSYANLINANLTGADLSNANLSGAVLSTTDLPEELVFDDLAGADLSDADLTDADLSGVDLTGAYITDEQFEQAASLAGTTLPDGTEHE